MPIKCQNLYSLTPTIVEKKIQVETCDQKNKNESSKRLIMIINVHNFMENISKSFDNYRTCPHGIFQSLSTCMNEIKFLSILIYNGTIQLQIQHPYLPIDQLIIYLAKYLMMAIVFSIFTNSKLIIDFSASHINNTTSFSTTSIY